MEVYNFETFLDRREALATTALDADPEMRVPLPGNALLPFILALVVIFTLVGSLIHWQFVMYGSILALILIGIWHWPLAKERSMDWVKAGPEESLEVSTVIKGQGKHAPYYYGVLLFILIETVEFGALIASYFYLRSSTSDWPPGDIPKPDLLLPTIGTLLLLGSVIPTYLGDKAIKKDDKRGLQIGAFLTVVMDAVFIILLIVHLAMLNYKWDTNAYSSVYWTLVISHLLFAGVMLLENFYILILALQGYYNAERHWAVEVDGISSYFVVAAWVAVYATVFLSPYLL